MREQLSVKGSVEPSSIPVTRRTRLLSSISRPYLVDLTTPIFGNSKQPNLRQKIVGGDSFQISRQRESVLNEVLDLISPSVQRVSPLLLKLEKEELSKAGPKSLRPSGRWWNGVDPYFGNFTIHPDLKSLSLAIEAVLSRVGRELDRGKFIPLKKVNVPLSTYSGAPYFTKTSEVYDAVIADAKVILDKILLGKEFEYFYSVLGHRGQSKGLYEVPKQRVVWQYPKATVVVGLSWLQSVLPGLSRLEEFAGWNHWGTTDSVVHGLLEKASAYRSNVISVDFNQFDATVSPLIVDGLFKSLKLSRPLLSLLSEFFTSPIFLPEGLRAGRRHGVPSGHAWTNLIDSLANLVCLHYVAIRTGRRLVGSTVLGDDSLAVYDKPIDLNEMSIIAKELGLKLNPEKSTDSAMSCHFLQKIYLRDGVGPGGIRSIIRTLNGMGTLERWSNEISAVWHVARWWTQLDEVRHNPARFKFLNYLKRKDREGFGVERIEDVLRTIVTLEEVKERARWNPLSTSVPASFWFRDLLV